MRVMPLEPDNRQESVAVQLLSMAAPMGWGLAPALLCGSLSVTGKKRREG